MANRIVPEDILRNEAVASLSPQAEVFYRRLLSVVDDHGRFDARPGVLLGWLYTFSLDETTTQDIADWLEECEAGGLVATYTADDGKPYLLYRGLSTPRAKTSDYPDPPPELVSRPVRLWENRADKSLVYFIFDPAAKAVKIGSALCPYSRLRAIQTSNPNTLTIIGTKEGGRAKEKEYHRRFEALRIRPNGEWFRFTGALLDFLSEEGFC